MMDEVNQHRVRVDAITQLLNEMEEIEGLARSCQEGSPRFPQPAELQVLQMLREKYYAWLQRAAALLNDEGQKSLYSHYQGSNHSIHNYLANPDKSYNSSFLTGRDSKYVWSHPFEFSFRRPFNEQRLLLMQANAYSEAHELAPPPNTTPKFDAIRLHSRVRATTQKLFSDGHFRQAIFQATLALNEAVQERSGQADLDGVQLMQKVFSEKSPILKFGGHPDYQLGFMWLYSGVVMAVRNPRAHAVGEAEDLDANEALELLAMISALFRALDSSTKVEPSSGN